MVTHSVSPVTRVGFEKEKHLNNQATTSLPAKDKAAVSAPRILKWFGVISTVLLSAAALAPDILGIPENLRPWVFLTAIFWVLAFCAGMFDL